MKKVISALAILTAGGVVLASGVGTAVAAPAPSSDKAKSHKVARNTPAAPGKASRLSSVTSPQASTTGKLPKVDVKDTAAAKLYNFYSYRALDADTDGIRSNGTRVQLWDDNGTESNQSWLFTSTDTVGLYKINNMASGRALDADTDTIGGNGTTVQLWDDLGATQANQLWWLVATGYHDADNGNELYKWVNYQSGRVLDADLDTIGDNGTPVQLWDDLGVDGYNQDWEF